MRALAALVSCREDGGPSIERWSALMAAWSDWREAGTDDNEAILPSWWRIRES